MILTLIALISMLIIFLMVMNAVQKHQQKELERKNSIISAQTKNIEIIESNIRDLKDIQISPKATAILLNRILYCVDTMLECFPKNREYLQLREMTMLRIKENVSIETEKSLPRAMNEKHMLNMIRTLKRTVSILNQEQNRNASASLNVGKQISHAEFFIAYLTVNHYVELADNALNNKILGTARDRYEAALKTIESAPPSVGSNWIESREAHCKERLDAIHNAMKSSNEDHVRINNPISDDETGLDRMLDGKKNKIAVNY